MISTCSSWFGVFGGEENTSFATSKLGKVVSVKKIKVFVSVLDLGFRFCSSAKTKNSTKMKEKQDQKGRVL